MRLGQHRHLGIAVVGFHKQGQRPEAGVHMKISMNIRQASTEIDQFAATQPIIERATTAPPITMFCGVARFSRIE